MKTFTIIYRILKTSKIKFYLFILIFLICTLDVISLTIDFFQGNIEKNIINKVENRLIYINGNNVKKNIYDEIISLSNVENVFFNMEPVISKSVEFGEKYVKYINPILNIKPNYKNLNDFGYNEILIPKEFLKDDIDEHNIIGKKIFFTINDKDIDFTVSDIYTTNEHSQQFIYISSNNDLNQYIECSEYIVLVDEKSNLKKVQNELKELGYEIEYINDSFNTESDVYIDIIKFLNIFLKMCYFILFIIFAILIFSNLNEKKFSIALLKTLGYSNIFILYIIFFSYLFIILISFINSLLINKFIGSLIFHFFGKNNFFNLEVCIKNNCLIFIAFIFVTFLSLYKIKKINIIKLLKK